MGFDVYGVKPQINTEKTDTTLYPIYSELELLEDFKEQHKLLEGLTSEDRKKYWNSMERYEEDNPGVYFRNNVWWWRPLWHFVCQQCSDILSEEEMNAGSYNDGKVISKAKSKKISKRLVRLLDNGTVKEYEEEYQRLTDEEEPDSFSRNYPFAEENVRRFATFVGESGGFQIC
ncbi:MAG: hypothetical protein GOVbin4296_24 [Prokaryotic dsDNA virus sp.]|nr:MAG: hypothetical protein GOVbin4296_24 [Prokaryotic dsDNA virus sp.]|tara:strand:- start:839 stop:1360 length:522 start_codon:yes stop_codon:yes gene_type:complete